MRFTPLTYANTKSAQEQFSIIGGLYATEVLRTLHTPYLKQTQAVCLLLECEKSSSSCSGWYRVNINIDTDDVQYLRRNNVYTVIIKDILSQGLILPMMLTEPAALEAYKLLLFLRIGKFLTG